MAFRIGNSQHDIYKITGGKNVKYGGVYVGKSFIWSEALLEVVKRSLNHAGIENSAKDYTLENQYVNTGDGEGENIEPEFDPSGGEFDFACRIQESSSWHFLSFKLIIPEEVDLIDVKEEGQETSLAEYILQDTVSLSYTGYEQTYNAKIVTVKFPSEGLEMVNIDAPLRLYFKLGSNGESGLAIRDIVFYDYANAFDEWNQLAPDDRFILTIYRQRPDFSYQTVASWISPKELHSPTATNPLNGMDGSSVEMVAWDNQNATVYLAIAFGISQDGGKTWLWGPPNDHRDENGNFSETTGNILYYISDYMTVTVDNNYFTAEIGGLLEQYDYYILAINLSFNKNDKLDDGHQTIYYQWQDGGDNTKWNPEKVSGGTINGPELTTTRTLQGIERFTGTGAKSCKISVTLNYEKHSFKLG